LRLPVRNLAVPESMVGSGWPRWNCSQIDVELCHLGAATPERGVLTGDPSLTHLELNPGSFSPLEPGSAGMPRDDRLAKEGRAIDQAVALEMMVPQSRTQRLVSSCFQTCDLLTASNSFVDSWILLKSLSLPLGGVPHFRSNGLHRPGRPPNPETGDGRFFFKQVDRLRKFADAIMLMGVLSCQSRRLKRCM
jgi:hypothetical protein